MTFLRTISDGLANLMSGRGTQIDRNAHRFWHHTPMPADQIEAAYRSSWLISKVVDVPAMDMVREWREWEADADEVKRIEDEERRLKVRETILTGMIYGRLGGGVVVIGSGTDMASPARPTDKVLYLKALPRWFVTLGKTDWDVTSENFGEPSYFTLNGSGSQDRIHPSRVIVFKGERVPGLMGAMSDEQFWGDSIVARVDQAVKNADTATDGFAALIDEAKIDVFKFAHLYETLMQPDGDAKAQRRLELAANGKSVWRAIALDKDDDWQQRQITWAGMPDIIVTYLGIVAGAADIPATRLLGKSPDGMNATGAGDEKNYHAMIAARQDMTLRPALDKLDALMLPSLGIGTDTFWQFSPLDTPTEKEIADIEKIEAETYGALVNSGLIPESALAKSVQARMVDSGRWPVLGEELEKLPDMPEGGPDDDDPSALAATPSGKERDPNLAGGAEPIGSGAARRAAEPEQ